MIDATFFAGNRERLSEQCQGIIVLTAYNALQSSGDMAALFRQEANFWYVTGIGDPDWQLIMHDGKSWLVAPDISEAHKVFDGGMSHETAQIISGVDEIINYSEASALLTHLARKYQIVYTLEQDPYQKYYNFTCNPAPGKLRRQLHRHFNEVRDCRQELATLRARKQPEEIACITRAVQLTMQAFSGVKQHLDTYAHEYEVAAMFDYEFRRHNATLLQ